VPPYRYVDLLYYNQRSLIHVSATYCGHLHGGVLWRNITYYVETVDKYKTLHFRKKVQHIC